jgi:hypothetical protein
MKVVRNTHETLIVEHLSRDVRLSLVVYAVALTGLGAVAFAYVMPVALMFFAAAIVTAARAFATLRQDRAVFHGAEAVLDLHSRGWRKSARTRVALDVFTGVEIAPARDPEFLQTAGTLLLTQRQAAPLTLSESELALAELNVVAPTIASWLEGQRRRSQHLAPRPMSNPRHLS